MIRLHPITLPRCRMAALSRRRRAFTLAEVLAAITIIAIVLPSIMYGLSLAANTATLAKHRTQATTLAKTKLDELLVDYNLAGGQLAGTSGDFSDLGWPDYHWSATVAGYPSATSDGFTTSLQELDVTVSWQERNQVRDATLSTLVYQNASTTSGLGGALP